MKDTIHSPALEGNLLNDSADRSIFIYLPPTYFTLQLRRYPVIYLLHGVGDTNNDWINGQYQGLNVQEAMNTLISAGKIDEMIVVIPDSSNFHQGCFYTNSPVTGNWEDFITEDLVKYIDSRYRTLSDAAGRGLAGHSMGGYGAIKLGMKHPDIYSAVYALSPCCFEWAADLSIDNPFWSKVINLKKMDQQAEKEFYPKFFISVATAWSPNPEQTPFYMDLPFELVNNKVQPKEPAYSKWAANLLLMMAGQYRTNLARLRGIGFDYGSQDQFKHIPLGSRAFSKFLTANGIAHQVEEYQGDHFNQIRERFEKKVLPFFSEIFVNQGAAGKRK
ncbi:MAG: alpha/beta fold hydrolase [Acidobacteriota bacterium]